MKRIPAKEMKIKDADGEGERGVFICTVIDFNKSKGEGRVDDGTGVATVILEDFLFAERMEDLVRIIGRIYKTDDDTIIRAEIVQKMDVDAETYRKVVEYEALV